jgi:hypothetical protein
VNADLAGDRLYKPLIINIRIPIAIPAPVGNSEYGIFPFKENLDRLSNSFYGNRMGWQHKNPQDWIGLKHLNIIFKL